MGQQDRMKPSPYYDRIVDVLKELVKFTLLTNGLFPYLTTRYRESKEAPESLPPVPAWQRYDPATMFEHRQDPMSVKVE